MPEQTLKTESFDIALNDDLRLRGRVKTSGDGARKPIVIVAHGFRGHQDWGFWPDVTDRFAARGYYAVGFDFSRITAAEDGLDEERASKAGTLSQELLDIDAIVRHALEGRLPFPEEADPQRSALLGHSRAGGSSIVYAGENSGRIGAVVVWNGGASPIRSSGEPDLSPLQKAVALDYEANPARFDTAKHFAELSQPALIVQGDGDSERLLSFVNRLQELAPNQTYASIPGANHTFNASHPYEGANEALDSAFEVTIGFLDSKLKRGQ
ncbi:hypothetical protein B1A99_32090 [Cohnella sp. CIP 111063]|uniref:alpha/beta hydrolase family protein n=1 Tax=unclassified Cohnella TaxID=2636738 RepID=UPI000B8C2FAA|nr:MULTISPECIES: dienelactone hydrolase family protein [unclassified Cohnella]OXS52835.1 hypothetical protein B1A99_32090 [Cohnella sp. CIP 111063]PRX59808.1 dienelactone hydrolase [Cohnella sp. SGD-V74]